MAWDGTPQEEESRAQRVGTAHLAEGRQLRGVHVGQQLDGRILHTVAHCTVHLLRYTPGHLITLAHAAQHLEAALCTLSMR